MGWLGVSLLDYTWLYHASWQHWVKEVYDSGATKILPSQLIAFSVVLQLGYVDGTRTFSLAFIETVNKIIFPPKFHNSWALSSSQGTHCAQNQFVG